MNKLTALYDTPGYLARQINYTPQWIVENARSGKQYIVDAEKSTCTCPHHTFRGVRCKHIDAIADELWWQEEAA